MSNFAVPPQAPTPSGTHHAPPSQWPMVIGSIAIAFGAIGAMMSLWGLASSTFLSSLSSPGMPPGFTMPPELTTFTVVDSLLGLVLAAMLVTGGIATVRRRAGGVKMLRNYAIIRLVLVIPLTVTQGVLTARMMDQMIAALEKAEADDDAEADTGAAQADGAAATADVGAAPAAANDASATDAPAPAPKPAASGNAGPPVAAVKQVMMASAVGGTACAGLLAAVWPTVLLVLLANGRRKDEIESWPRGL